MRILVVDDVSANAQLLEAVLSPHGYDVVTATDGVTALELVETAKPDLVLLDVVMPDMDGYMVCKRLRERQETAVLPVIMITSSIGREKTKAIEADADDFIPKPFNHEELLPRVRSLLRIKSYHDTIPRSRNDSDRHRRVVDVPRRAAAGCRNSCRAASSAFATPTIVEATPMVLAVGGQVSALTAPLARARGATAHVVHVVETDVLAGEDTADLESLTHAQALLEACIAELSETGVPVTGELLHSYGTHTDVAAEIVRRATDLGAGAIVLRPETRHATISPAPGGSIDGRRAFSPESWPQGQSGHSTPP